MADITLPGRLRADFKRLARSVLRLFPKGVVAMGGGCLLEAMWSHRESTHLDLFVAPQNLAAAHDDGGGHARFYSRFIESLRLAGVSVDGGMSVQQRQEIFLKGACRGRTPWSIAAMHYANPDHPMLDSIEGTGIRAATLTEIFMGKIVGRAYNANKVNPSVKQPIPIRDCYDICVCAALEPEILLRILNAIPNDARERVAMNFLRVPDDLSTQDEKPVIGPTWNLDLQGLAARIGYAIESLDLSLIPPAWPRNPDTPSRFAEASEDAPCPSK